VLRTSLFSVFVWILVTSIGLGVAYGQPTRKTVLDGVYTVMQAQRGEIPASERGPLQIGQSADNR
jgi:hypothetical protein